MSKQYEHYIYQQLEPTIDPFARVRYKRDYVRRPVVEVQEPVVKETERESRERQDEYLKKHGIL
jgi:hypothetical protein